MSKAVAGFDWDGSNQEKCQRHGVSRAEIEELFVRPVMVLPDAGHSAAEKRFRAVGKTRLGRHVFLVFTLREHGDLRLIRPISARFMHRKEIAHYEGENPELSE